MIDCLTRRGRACVRLWLSGPQEEQEARTQEGAPVPVPPAGRPAAVPVATDRDGRAQGRLHGGREAGGRITIGAAAPEGGSPAGAAPRSSRMPPGELRSAPSGLIGIGLRVKAPWKRKVKENNKPRDAEDGRCDGVRYQSPYATVAYPISAVEYGYTGEPEDLDYGQEALAFFKANP